MLRSLVISLALFITTGSAIAQFPINKSYAELIALLSKSNPDTNRVKYLLQLSDIHFANAGEPGRTQDSSLFYIRQAVLLTHSISIARWKWVARGYLAKFYLDTGKNHEGKTVILEIVEELKAQPDQQLLWLHFLAQRIFIGDTSSFTRLDCYKKILAIHEKTNNQEGKLETYLQMADVHFLEGKFTLAETEILNLIETNKTIAGHSLNNAYYLLSVINRNRGDMNKALMFSLKCINAAENNKDSVALDYFFGELALVYGELGLPAKSSEWYRKTLAIRKHLQQPPVMIYRTVGFLLPQLLKINEREEALRWVSSMEKLAVPEDRTDSALIAQVKANYYHLTKQSRLAEQYYLEMIRAGGDFEGNNEFASQAFQEIGGFYTDQREYQKAGYYLNKALDLFPVVAPLSRKKDLQLALYKVDSSTGNYLSAIGHLREYQLLKDSVLNEAKSRQIEELQIQYETAKKEQNIQLLEKETKLQESRLTQSSNTRNWILGAVILLLIIIALLLNNARLKQRTNKKLEAQQKDLRSLVEEKEWLVKEIHHRVKNNLHTISGLLDNQSGFLKTEEAILAIRDSQHRVNAMSLIHQKLYQSENLSVTDMPSYIHELVAYLQDSFNTGKQIRFDLLIERMEMDLTHSIPIGLILNEAITNAIKYAFPGNREGIITVSLERQEQSDLLLSVSDNGKGIANDFEKSRNNSMGINLMQGLSEDIGGSFQIENKKGTHVKIIFPYTPATHKNINLTIY